MGIVGLLPLLQSVCDDVHLSEFGGVSMGVDALCWLHRAIYTCAQQLALAQESDAYVRWCERRLDMLLHHGIKPWFVFDGGALPAKQGKEVERATARAEALAAAAAALDARDAVAANAAFARAVDVSPQIAYGFIRVLQARGIPFTVAPYEADAQLAFLCVRGLVSAVLTEDSDLIPYGCAQVVLKLQPDGSAKCIRRARLPQCTALSFVHFTDDMLLNMCILAGCDYLPSIPGMGAKRAHGMVAKARTTDRLLQLLRFEWSDKMPPTYCDDFRKARMTFLHQRVYDPIARRLATVTPLPDGVDAASPSLDFLGPHMPDERVAAIAEAQLDPCTGLAYRAPCGPSPRESAPGVGLPRAPSLGFRSSSLNGQRSTGAMSPAATASSAPSVHALLLAARTAAAATVAAVTAAAAASTMRDAPEPPRSVRADAEGVDAPTQGLRSAAADTNPSAACLRAAVSAFQGDDVASLVADTLSDAAGDGDADARAVACASVHPGTATPVRLHAHTHSLFGQVHVLRPGVMPALPALPEGESGGSCVRVAAVPRASAALAQAVDAARKALALSQAQAVEHAHAAPEAQGAAVSHALGQSDAAEHVRGCTRARATDDDGVDPRAASARCNPPASVAHAKARAEGGADCAASVASPAPRAPGLTMSRFFAAPASAGTSSPASPMSVLQQRKSGGTLTASPLLGTEAGACAHRPPVAGSGRSEPALNQGVDAVPPRAPVTHSNVTASADGGAPVSAAWQQFRRASAAAVLPPPVASPPSRHTPAARASPTIVGARATQLRDAIGEDTFLQFDNGAQVLVLKPSSESSAVHTDAAAQLPASCADAPRSDVAMCIPRLAVSASSPAPAATDASPSIVCLASKVRDVDLSSTPHAHASGKKRGRASAQREGAASSSPLQHAPPAAKRATHASINVSKECSRDGALRAPAATAFQRLALGKSNVRALPLMPSPALVAASIRDDGAQQGGSASTPARLESFRYAQSHPVTPAALLAHQGGLASTSSSAAGVTPGTRQLTDADTSPTMHGNACAQDVFDVTRGGDAVGASLHSAQVLEASFATDAAVPAWLPSGRGTPHNTAPHAFESRQGSRHSSGSGDGSDGTYGSGAGTLLLPAAVAAATLPFVRRASSSGTLYSTTSSSLSTYDATASRYCTPQAEAEVRDSRVPDATRSRVSVKLNFDVLSQRSPLVLVPSQPAPVPASTSPATPTPVAFVTHSEGIHVASCTPPVAASWQGGDAAPAPVDVVALRAALPSPQAVRARSPHRNGSGVLGHVAASSGSAPLSQSWRYAGGRGGAGGGSGNSLAACTVQRPPAASRSSDTACMQGVALCADFSQ